MGRFDNKDRDIERDIREANKPIKMGIWIAFGLGGFTAISVMYFTDVMWKLIMGN